MELPKNNKKGTMNMDQMEKTKLVEAMKASAPRQAQPVISQEEMEQFPCTITPVTVPVAGEDPVTVYVTKSAAAVPGAPLVVNYHGGGFIRGRSDRDELFCRRLAHTFACVVIDVDYALAPDYAFPVAVHQARAVALWAKEQAASLGCDPDMVLLVGQSAGGNLVANVCMDEVAEPVVKPIGALIAYAPLDLQTDPVEKFHPERDMPAERARNYNALYCLPEKAGDPRVSPLFAEGAQLQAFPQTLVITAGDDSLAAEGEAFAKKLARAGVEVTCKRFNGCVHGFFINRMDAWEDGIELVHRFLRRCLTDAQGSK